MKSYRHYCALALALDRVGERWTLLVVRELLTGAKRYSDLQEGLPGVATNLLSTRLKAMERNGLIERRSLPPPGASMAYFLTERGEALARPVHALVRWGGQLMRERRRGYAFRPQWLGVALAALLENTPLTGPALRVQVELPEGGVLLRLAPDGVRVVPANASSADVTLRAPAMLVLGLAAGEVGWTTALASGLEVTGAAAAVTSLRRMLARKARPAARAR
jgi:DNA-binding HxlR family transcriptional regulator